ncbi:hypothetical protein OWK30_09165 [Deferribacter abyssi]
MRYENGVKNLNVKRKNYLQSNIEGRVKSFKNREKEFFHQRGNRKVSEAESYIEVRYLNSVLDIIVKAKDIEFWKLVELLKKKLPDADSVLNKDLKIQGKFPYQIGIWIAKRYYKLASSISVFDPVTKDYVRIF